MTIKDIIQLLEQQGKVVQARKRSDGGYLITRIDGMSFKGASGNIQARKIVGAELSHARSYQLERIRPPKKVAPMKRRLAPLPSDILKELRKVQRLWRKEHKDIGGTISTRGVRYQLEQYGEEYVKASLNKAYRYTQGFAYLENVQWLISRLQQDLSKVDSKDVQYIQSIISKIQNKALSFREDWIHEVYEQIYEFEKGSLAADELARRIDSILHQPIGITSKFSD